MSVSPLQSVDQGDAWAALSAALQDRFRADLIPPDPEGLYSLQPCQVPKCDRVRHSSVVPLCSLHKRHHRVAQAGDATRWAATADPRPALSPDDPPDKHASIRGVFVLAPLSGRLRDEIAYGLQVRGTPAAPQRARAHVVNDLVRRLVAHDVESLLDHDAADLMSSLAMTLSAARGTGCVRATLAAGRDFWARPGRRGLGLRRSGSGYFADFDSIEPAWFGNLVQRWTEYRLAGEQASPQYAGTQVALLARFGRYLEGAGVADPAQLTRDVLLQYRDHVNKARKPDGQRFSAATLQRELGTVNLLLEEARALEWVEGLPASARFLPGEFPRREPAQPRYISEFVMQQLEAPGALDMVRRTDMRVAIQIIMTTGIRLIHAITLTASCLEELPRDSGASAWALRYLDTKTRKDMRVPLRDDVARAIREQQRRVRKEFGEDCDLLFPRTRKGCVAHVSPQTLHDALVGWCAALDLTDETGAKTRVTAHQFRHTCGTRWINNNVPQHVVKDLLGHRSDRMVSVYAHLHNSTVRREWEAYQRVNITGERISPPDGEVAEVEWMLEQVSRATQALPNGYCTLPIQQTCPHANACLTCDSFATDPTFLPVLERQRDEHGELLRSAEEAGQSRMAEINRVPFVNLTNIIEGLRRLPPKEDPA